MLFAEPRLRPTCQDLLADAVGKGGELRAGLLEGRGLRPASSASQQVRRAAQFVVAVFVPLAVLVSVAVLVKVDVFTSVAVLVKVLVKVAVLISVAVLVAAPWCSPCRPAEYSLSQANRR